MLYTSCAYQFNHCSWQRIPLISNVIADSMFDRVFILLNTAYFIGVHQVNVRVLYSRFHLVIPSLTNTLLLSAGMLSSISLPMIGLFDNREYIALHYAWAGLFFISSAYYLSHTAFLMYRHRDQIGGNMKLVEFNYGYSKFCTLLIVGLCFTTVFFCDRFWLTVVLEWLVVFAYMTLTMLIMSSIPSYD